MKRRAGRFKVNSGLYEEMPEINEEFWRWLEFIPYRVEMLYAESVFECIGISPHFEEVKEGSIAPEYKFFYDGNTWSIESQLEVEKR